MPAVATIHGAAQPVLDRLGHTAAAETRPTRSVLERERTWRAVAVAALAAFGWLYAIVRHDRSAELDLAITLRVQARQHPTLDRLMRLASWAGFPPQSRALPPVIVAGLAVTGHPIAATCQALGWGTALLSTVIKAAVGRPRPLPPRVRVALAPLGGTSFPSGHVLTYVGVYGFLAYLAHTRIERAAVRRIAVAFLVGLIGLVGPSRIHQGHHWPTDVAASYLLGLSYLVALTGLHRRLTGDRARQVGGQVSAMTEIVR